jgi:hypothetical protein
MAISIRPETKLRNHKNELRPSLCQLNTVYSTVARSHPPTLESYSEFSDVGRNFAFRRNLRVPKAEANEPNISIADEGSGTLTSKVFTSPGSM